MVLTLLIITRKVLRVSRTTSPIKHLESMSKILLTTGMIVGLRLHHRVLHGLVQRQRVRALHVHEPRLRAHYSWAYWTMFTCNVAVPQLFWFKRCRTIRRYVLFVASIFVNIGMWFERFNIVVTSLQSRLPAVVLELLHPEPRRGRHPGRQLRPVLHLLPAVRARRPR